FPGVPAGHPAQGAMTMNVSANLLGLDNAATPLGLKAMRELETLNPRPGTATDAQILFVVLNTAGITLIPTAVIAIRQSIALRQGVAHFNAADVLLPTLLATFASCLAGLLAVAVCQRLPLYRPRFLLPLAGVLALLAALLAGLAQLPAEQAARITGLAGAFCILALVTAFLVAGAWRRVPVYDTFVEGAKEGFGVAVQIIPYLVGMLCAIALFRAAGCMDWLLAGIGRGVAALGWDTAFLPALPVGLMKILSGAGARGLMVDVMQAYGVDSFPARLAAIIQGSTETTFYVLAVYGGSVGLKNMRHALGCALFADAAGLAAAIGLGYAFFR
ncbi:nucleoside recognition domain-containing protein, partial [Xylophilus sp. ASV27]|uniref:nucleoside recognition domain-containing protein n=1 Tax=Xylophilus sp. ASV27 TaxID=2795129 RepID=UPI0018EC08EE